MIKRSEADVFRKAALPPRRLLGIAGMAKSTGHEDDHGPVPTVAPDRRMQSETFGAFTLIELMVAVAVLALCAATFFPALARTKAPSQRIYCVNNLKGIGEAFQTWGQDHGDAFPMRVPVNQGGYADFIGTRTLSSTPLDGLSRGVFGMFRCLSNQLSTPKVLICPAENEARVPATTFGSFTPPADGVVPLTNDLNVSYFVGVDAAERNPHGFLAGDHNLGADGNLVPRIGFVIAPQAYVPDFKMMLGTNFDANGGVGWLTTMHSVRGNVALADGSVSTYDRAQLQNALRNSGMKQPAFASGPAFKLAPGCSGYGANRIQFP